MELEEKAKMWGGIVTTIFHILLFLLLLFVCFEHITPKEEDGVPVSMGAPDMGGNDLFEPTPEAEVPEVAQAHPVAPPTPVAPAPAVAPQVETQTLEQTVAVPTAKKKVEKTSTQSNAAEEEKRKQQDLQRKQELQKQKELAAEQARLKAEAEAKRKAELEAEAKKKAEQEAIRKKANNAANVFKKNTSAQGNGTDANSNGTGSGSKPGTQGAANGSTGGGMGGNGNIWSLAGRQIQGTLPRPAYTVNEEGYIIVDIAVDNDGNVVSAEIKKSFGITSPALRNAAINAAKKAKFSKKDGFKTNQKGTITYNFKLQ